MRRILTTTCLLILISLTNSWAQTTYTSAGSGGAWNNSASWTPVGVPQRDDHIIIQGGDVITIAVASDNGAGPISINSLNTTYPNVGVVGGSSNFTDIHQFYHTGNVTIEAGGTLEVTANIGVMLGGTTDVSGTLDVDDGGNNNELVNLGLMNINTGASVLIGDDFIVSGNSRTIIDISWSGIGDDIYIDNPDAQICGIGSMTVGGIIQVTNGADASTQVCSGFTITCSSGDCLCRVDTNPGSNNCGGSASIPGSGGFSFDLTGYNYAKTITIDKDQVTGDLTNFPVLISFTDATIATTGNGGGMENSSGYDIAFATANDCGVLTQLYHALETYDESAGTIVAWVNVPAVSSTVDTDIFMYYGNSAITTDPSSTATYDPDYISVWHMEEDPGGTAPQILDATTTGHDATSNGTMSGNVPGQIANAIDFDGGNDYLQTPSNELETENDFTVSAWFNADATAQSHILWEGVGTQNGWGGAFGAQEMNLSLGYCCQAGAGQPSTADDISFFLGDIEDESNSDVISVHNGPDSFTDITNWHYLVGTISDLNTASSLGELWFDGSTLGTNTGVNSARTDRTGWNTNLRIGRPGANERYFEGQIDEVRISKVVRSDAWIQTEYNNQSVPSTFFTVTSGATVSPCGPLPIELMYFRGKIQDHKVLLEWATASEINNDYFTIERSIDGLDFHEITTMPGAGNTSETLNYTYTDKNPFFGISYYRLKQTDYDGQFTYSNIIAIKLDRGLQGLDFTLFPNPTKDKLSVMVTGNAVLDLRIEIYNTHGQKLKNIVSSNRIDGFELDVEHLNAGIYLVHLINEDFRGIRKFVKK